MTRKEKRKSNGKLKKGLQIFGVIAILLSLFPLIAADYWWIRIFDFPHLQLTILTLIALLVFFIKFNLKDLYDYIFASALLGCFLFQLMKIYPYTPLASKEVLTSEKTEKENQLSLFTANVLQKNEERKLLTGLIRKNRADLLLLTETDQKWMEAVDQVAGEIYPYSVKVPQSNTYGMLLYSKYELFNTKVDTIVDDSIPSIRTQIRLRSGDSIQLYCIHPTPPMPQHNPRSTDRDAEMMKFAKFSRENKLPVIVLGDFNDVAWSNTTKLFQRVSGLLDIRKGRGFYNTYNAKYPLLRWPLDHIFISPEFRFVEFNKGPSINSDHFPLYIVLQLYPQGAQEQKGPAPTTEDFKKASEIIGEEIKQDLEKETQD